MSKNVIEEDAEVFGIDLGTTYSCIAEIDSISKLPKVIENEEGRYTTPSVVYIDDSNPEPLVGMDAKHSMKYNPSNAIAFIKRKMNDPSFKKTIGTFEATPVSVSSLILKKLVTDANRNRELRNKKNIKDVIITVPAYFDNTERTLTRRAGEEAGLNVIDLLSEPTAAALSYASDPTKKKNLEGKTFMVYDLGGGTFDVNIIRMDSDGLEVLVTDGDSRLGGVDWDVRLVNQALKVYCKSKKQYDDIADTKDGGALILAAEDCKKKLTIADSALIKFIYKNKLYTETVQRSVFEELTTDLLDKTIEIARRAAGKIEKGVSGVETIILVGGSCYMPMVKKRIQQEFPLALVDLSMFEPDMAVAKGAAIQACHKAHSGTRPIDGPKIIKDLSSRSYGMGTTGKGNRPIIKNLILKTDPIEFERTVYFETISEGQSSVKIPIYENTRDDLEIPKAFGKLISEKFISWGYPVPEGTEVTAHVKRKSDGTVQIEVECVGKRVSFDISPE